MFAAFLLHANNNAFYENVTSLIFKYVGGRWVHKIRTLYLKKHEQPKDNINIKGFASEKGEYF